MSEKNLSEELNDGEMNEIMRERGKTDFEKGLESLLNKHGKDSLLNIPDYELAKYLSSILRGLESVLKKYEESFQDPVEIEDSN